MIVIYDNEVNQTRISVGELHVPPKFDSGWKVKVLHVLCCRLSCKGLMRISLLPFSSQVDDIPRFIATFIWVLALVVWMNLHVVYLRTYLKHTAEKNAL